MVARNPAEWFADNRLMAAGIALAIVATIAAFALFSSDDKQLDSRLTQPNSESDAREETTREDGDKPVASGESSGRTSGTISAPGGESLIPGLTKGPSSKSCTPARVDEVGVTDSAITIGQVVTESNQLPQQLGPARLGLEAFVKVLNDAGGLCKRMLKLESRNDNLNPATHNQDMRELAERSLAFVGNESLLDFLDYEREPPFAPTVEGGGGFVPDVGGLAFSYGRSQSAWHAGVIGSVSPVLVGGGNYRFFVGEAKAKGTPCRKAAVLHLREPTGASEDQARLGQVSLEEDWGGNLGAGNTQLYSSNLQDPVPAYEALVDRMVADGMNCAFAYTDLQSSINFAQALNNRGVWPPDRCARGDQCFRVVYIPLSAYDTKFVRDGGEGARSVSTFVPHLPLTETGDEAMKVYLDAIKAVRGATPSTFSILGFTSGLMLVEALQACPAAPTRDCLMKSLREMKNFTAGGLLGGTTPFRTTRATFDRYGSHDWKWIFNRSVAMRVLDRNGKRDFYRINPKSGFFTDTLKVARGTPG